MFLAPVRAWGVLILRLSFRIITNQQKIPLRPWRLCGSTIKSEGNNVPHYSLQILEANVTSRIIRWVAGMLVAQAAIVATLVKLL